MLLLRETLAHPSVAGGIEHTLGWISEVHLDPSKADQSQDASMKVVAWTEWTLKIIRSHLRVKDSLVVTIRRRNTPIPTRRLLHHVVRTAGIIRDGEWFLAVVAPWRRRNLSNSISSPSRSRPTVTLVNTLWHLEAVPVCRNGYITARTEIATTMDAGFAPQPVEQTKAVAVTGSHK